MKSITASDRRSLIRLAHSLPTGSEERRAILAGLKEAYGAPSMEEDLEGFLEWLENRLNTPFPSMTNALGLKRGELKSLTYSQGDKGFIGFKGPSGTQITVAVLPPGTIEVSGKIQGDRINKGTFRYRPGSPGLHRGSVADIINHVEDQVPVDEMEYLVVTQSGSKRYPDAKSMERDWRRSGLSRSTGPIRPELRSQPTFEGLVGPMWGGRDRNKVTLRYEDGPTYRMMSM
jgi:hypothetical protein